MSTTKKRQEKNKHLTNNFFASISIWFAIFCWGGAYVAARFLLHPDVTGNIFLSPIRLATLRFGIASLFFVIPLAQAILRGQISGRDILLMILLGQLTFTLYYWLQYIGIEETNASISAILGVGLIPLFTTLLAPLFGEERLNLPLLATLLIGFFGVAFIVFQQPLSFSLQSGFLLGAACLLANTFFFALYNNLSRRWLRDISPLTLTSGTMVSGAIGLVLLSFLDPTNLWNKVEMLNPTQWIAILFLAVACSVCAYFAYNVALSKMDASRVAVYFYIEPIISIVLGITLLGERLTWQTLLGAATVGGSMVAVNHIKRHRE